jgi:hypothetical protein
MSYEAPAGPGTATLKVAMPGTVRPPTDAIPAMIAWLHAHGAPRTAEVLERLQRHGWTIEVPDPAADVQTEFTAHGRFADVEHARIAAREYHGRVHEMMRWAPGDRATDAVVVPLTNDQ